MQQQPIYLQFARLIVLLLLLGGTLWEGLYSPVAHVVSACMLALAVLVLGGTAVLSRTEIALWGGLGLSVALSLVNKVAGGTAVYGPVIVVGWALAFTLGRVAHQDREWLEPLLARIWAWSGPLVLVVGLLLLPYQPMHHSGRLASVLGYPIAVGALGLLGLAGTVGLKARPEVAGLLLSGNLLAILLSGSRGIWAVTAVLLIVLSFRFRGLLRRLVLPGALAVTAALWAGPAIAHGQALSSLIIVVLMGLTTLVALRFHFHIGIYAGIALGLWQAPGWAWLMGRAGTVADGSTIERITFMRDGLAMIIGHPFGAGFRAWHSLHLQESSYGYYSTEAHSALVDLTLAFGWLGGAAFVGFLGLFSVRVLCSGADSPTRTAVLVGLVAMTMHSLLDWTLSYGVFAIPLWLGVGLSRSSFGPGVVLSRAVLGVFAGIGIAAAVWLVGSSLVTNLAQTAASQGNYQAAERHATMAVAIQPWNDIAFATLAQARGATDGPNEGLAAVTRARQLGPREPWYAELEGQLQRSAGRPVQAAEAFRDAALLWPWEVGGYESALTAMIEMSRSAQIRGDLGVIDQIDRIGDSLLQRLDQQKRLEPSRTPRRPMETETPAIQQARAFFQSN